MNYGDALTERLQWSRIVAKLDAESRRLVAPVLAKYADIRGQRFEAWPGETLPYLVHPHNSTWRNERAVEIPVGIDFLTRHGQGTGMEFGNVLTHYGERPAGCVVVDKYEHRPGVVNMDIMDYEAPRAFDFIISISTLEHVGWDEKPRDQLKALAAFDRLRGMLKPGGRMLLTVPMGHHDRLDQAIMDGLPVDRQMTLVRDDGQWRRSAEIEFRPYPGKGRGADSVWIAEVQDA